MSDNKLIVQYRVESDGSLKKIAVEAKQAAESTDDLGKAQARQYKQSQGTAQNTSNSTRAFAKQTQGISKGLVPAYATLMAHMFALSEAFGALRRASELENLAKGLTIVGNAAGQNLPYVAKQLREITGAAISTEQALRATAVAVSAGFSTNQLVELTKVANGAAKALGRDLGDSFDRLVRGTAKLEPEILDELGIMIRLDDATKTYASSIGKAAGDLSRFERQQAFLNEAITQGQAKFSLVNEAVDAEPYAKLASTFNDLAKSILSVINTAITPFVELLSKSPTALVGAMVAFGGIVISKIIPAVGELVERQEALAATSHKIATEAAQDMSVKYVNALTKVNEKLTVMPKSVKNMSEALYSGTASIAQMEDAVKKLELSENRRVAALKTGSKETLAAREAELAKLREGKQALQELIALERSGGARLDESVIKQQNATVKAEGATRNADLLAQIGGSGPIESVRVATVAIKENFKDIGRTQGGLAKVAATGRAMSNSFALVGAALGNILPIIGQIIFFGGLLYELFSKLFAGSKLSQKTDEVVASFSSFVDISNQLNAYLSKTLTAEEEFAAKLQVRIGLADQVSNGIAEIIKANRELNKEEEDANLKDLVAARIRYNQALEDSAAGYEDLGFASILLDKAQKSYNATLEKNKTLESTQVVKIVEAAKAQAIATGLVAESSKELKKYDEILNNLGTTTNTDELQKRIDAVNEPLKKIKASTQEAEEASISYTNTVLKNQDKVNGKYGEVYTSIKGMENALRAVREASVESGDYVPGDGVTTKMKEQAAHLKASLHYVTGIAEAGVEETFRLAAEEIAKINQRIVLSAVKAKELAADAKRYGEFAKTSALFTKAQLNTLNASKKAEYESLQNKVKQHDLDNGILEVETRIAKETQNIKDYQEALAKALVEGNMQAAISAGRMLEITKISLEQLKAEQEKLKLDRERTELLAKMSAIQGELRSDTEIGLRAQIANVRDQQRLNSLVEKEATARMSILNIQESAAKRNKELERAQTGSTLTAEDEVKILKDYDAKFKKENEAKLNAELTRINLEFDLLDLQFQLEALKISNIQAAAGASAEERDALEAAKKDALAKINVLRDITKAGETVAGTTTGAGSGRQAAIDLAKAGSKDAEDQRTVAGLTAEEEARRKNQALRNSLLREEASLYESIGAAKAASMLRVAALSNEQAQIEKDLATIKAKEGEDSTVYLEKKLEAQKKLNEKAAEEAAIRAKITAGLSANGNTIAETAINSGVNTSAAQAKLAEVNNNPNASPEERAAAEAAVLETSKNAFTGAMDAVSSQMRSLGPEGELMATVLSSASMLTTTFSSAFDIIGDSSASTSDKIQAGLGAASALFSAYGQISKAASDARIRGIDQEIEAEKKRDGKSRESLAKISALEKKKEAEKKKAFETEKKMKIAQTIIGTAQGAMAAFTSLAGIPIVGPALGAAAAAMVVALGAKQLSMIQSTSYQGGGSIDSGPSSISVGNRQNTVDLAKAKSPAGELAYARGESGTGTGMTNYTPAFTGRAAGGNTAYMVGEQGPELFVPDRPGVIKPADDTEKMAAQQTSVNFTINTIDSSSMEDMLMKQRGNLIGMIREAANSHGEFFLENVNTNSLG